MFWRQSTLIVGAILIISGDSYASSTPHLDQSKIGALPIRFELNQGQTNDQVRFLTRGSGYTCFLTDSEAVFVFAEIRNVAGNASQKIIPPQNTNTEIEKTVLRMTFID